MERKTIFLALFSAFVACFFVACSNDSDALDINAIDVKVGTRSVGLSYYMTLEEIQTRLNEIGNKYGTQVIIDKTIDIDLITEDMFTELEEHLSLKKEISNNSTRESVVNNNENDDLYMNDSSIDEIMLMAAPPTEEVLYSGSFIKSVQYDIRNTDNEPSPAVCTVTINWESTNVTLRSVTASVEGHNLSAKINSYNFIGGESSDPAFSYTGTLTYTAVLIKKDTINGIPNYTYYDRKYDFPFSGSRIPGQI